MNYTLITSLGTGLYANGTYKETDYDFQNGIVIKAKLFMNAILQSNYRNISKIIIIGTRTSSWDILIDLTKTENEDFWMEVRTQCDGEGISDENINKLQNQLFKEKNIPVVLKVHAPKIDNNTTQEVFDVYRSIEDEIDPNNKILFDITHGFRSMPILIYQALQFNSTQESFPSVELIYGEFVGEDKKSYVRNLSEYWELSETTKALNEFNTKLDGRTLAKKLEPHWSRGAKVLKRFSEIVSLNYSLQIFDMLNQLRNSLTDDLSTKPSWVQTVKTTLQNIYNQINDQRVSMVLFKYANLLEEKKLYTQAVIALQVCMESAVAEHSGLSYDQMGDYDWWQNYGKSDYNTMLGGHGNLRNGLWRIEFCRNEIAHGGAKNRTTGNFPSASNIPSILSDGKTSVEEFLEISRLD